MSVKVKIAAVVVLYKKNYNQTDTYNSLLKDWNFPILIYDNSPQSQKIQLKPSESYYHNPQNHGVSTAYNFGVEWAKNKNCTHLLLLDSDSHFPMDAPELYINAVNSKPSSIILPAMYSANHKISPFYFRWGKSFYGDKIPFGEIELGKILAINSGTVLLLNVFDKTIKYNENLPLDWSDIAFFRTLTKSNCNTQHISLKVEHGLSEHEPQSMEQALFRYKLYLKGIEYVSKNTSEKILMLFWAKLKAFKLCLRHKSFSFFIHYIKNWNG